MEMKDISFISNTSKVTEKKTRKHRHFYGFLFAFSAGLVFALASVCKKRLKYMSSSQHTTIFCGGMIAYNLPMILYKRVEFIYPRKVNLLLLARAVFTTMAFNFIFLSLMYVPLADASVIGSCSPILTTVFARVFLKEPCGAIHGVCLVLTVLGVLMVSKLPLAIETSTMRYGASYFIGVAMSFFGALSFAMANIVVRLPSLISVHYSISVFYIGIFSVIVSSLITKFGFGFALPECGVDRWFMALLGFLGGAIETFATLALQYEEAAIAIMVISTTNIAANFLFQILVEGETPDIYTTSGAVIVTICILMIASRQKLTAFVKMICGKSRSIAVMK